MRNPGMDISKNRIIVFSIPMTRPKSTTRQKFEKVKSNPSDIDCPNPLGLEKIDIKVKPKMAFNVKAIPY